MAKPREWTDERILSEIRRLSKDGIAPPSKENLNLYRLTMTYFGSWNEACLQAGVKPQVMYKQRKKKSKVKRITSLPLLKRQKILFNINELMDNHCVTCKHFNNGLFVDSPCWKCPIGIEIREYGKQLEGVS